MCNEPGKVAQMRAGGNLGNASKKFSVFIRSCFTRCHFKIWNISFIAICHFHIWPEQLIFCADAAHKTNSVPVASNQAHNWTTRLIWVSTIFTVSINLIVVGQTVYCPNLGIKICKRLTYEERSRLSFPRYHHFDVCKACSHRRGVHVDRVVDVADVGSKHPPDKKVMQWEKRHSSLYIRWQPFNWTKNSCKSICKVTTMRDGSLSESQFTRSLWIFPLFWMFNMPVLSRSNHISECQFRNHQAVEAQTIGCNFRVVKRLHYQYNSSQQWSQVLWPAYFWKVLVLMLINFWKQQLTTWPNVQRNLT